MFAAAIVSAYLAVAAPMTTPTTTIPISVSPRVQPYTYWGRLALAQTQKRYPKAAIVDYLHVGRTTYSSTYAKETFKFWLKLNGREFGVYAKVFFDPVSNVVQQILFCETER